MADAGHSDFRPNTDRTAFVTGANRRTSSLGISAGLEFASLVDAGGTHRGGNESGAARPAIRLQFGDAADCVAKWALEVSGSAYSESPSPAPNKDRLGRLIGERLRSAEPVPCQVPVRYRRGKLQYRLRSDGPDCDFGYAGESGRNK